MIWRNIPFQRKLIGQVSQIRVRNIYTSNRLKRTFYEVLGLKSDATQAEIKKAYFEMSKLYHPDRIAATDDNLAKFREITAAYEVLSNENSKRLYDRGLLGPGIQEREDVSDVSDPIVKFYKLRQELSKEILKPSEDTRTWTPPLKKHEKSNISQKYNYFRKTAELTFLEEKPDRHLYTLVTFTIVICMILYNFRGSFVYNLFHDIDKVYRK